MNICLRCRRHVRPGSACPFCGSPVASLGDVPMPDAGANLATVYGPPAMFATPKPQQCPAGQEVQYSGAGTPSCVAIPPAVAALRVLVKHPAMTLAGIVAAGALAGGAGQYYWGSARHYKAGAVAGGAIATVGSVAIALRLMAGI